MKNVLTASQLIQPTSCAGAAAHDETHWIEVVDGGGLYPVKMLGPYGTARLADRACRGVMRLLNVRRYSAAVVSQRELDGRQQRSGEPRRP